MLYIVQSVVGNLDKPDPYQESTEIIASLENLNSEIREIWDVLNKRHDSSAMVAIPPTPTLMYSYLRWLRFHHLTAQPNTVQGEQVIIESHYLIDTPLLVTFAQVSSTRVCFF